MSVRIFFFFGDGESRNAEVGSLQPSERGVMERRLNALRGLDLHMPSSLYSP